MTLKLLHHEYCSIARDAGSIPYAYRSFTEKYGSYAKKYKLAMPIRRKPGEVLEVDQAGATLKIMDSAAGEETETYRELADHYRTVVVPSRICEPKDKLSVEGAVGSLSRQIIATLRNYQCFHIEDLNKEIHSRLEEMNTQEFQKEAVQEKACSRKRRTRSCTPYRKHASR